MNFTHLDILLVMVAVLGFGRLRMNLERAQSRSSSECEGSLTPSASEPVRWAARDVIAAVASLLPCEWRVPPEAGQC